MSGPPAGAGPGGPGAVRVRLDLDYDGTDFSGWAVQPGRRTVQAELTAALARVTRMPPGEVRIVVAGRTDAGVHATGQVCHADLPDDAWRGLPGRSDLHPADALGRRLRGVLPADVRVRSVRVAPPGFDARFSALRRRYAYRVGDDPAGVPPMRRRDVLAVRGRLHDGLDLGSMNAAAAGLLGLHDFAAFCRPRAGATTVRTLLDYRWDREADGLAVATVVADAFCHSMVRALVGALLPVGQGRRPVGWPAEVLAAGRRDPGVAVVPAHGLTLVEVTYPDDAGLAERAAAARAVRTLGAPGCC